MSCLDPETIRVIVAGVVLSITAVVGLGAIAFIAWKA